MDRPFGDGMELQGEKDKWLVNISFGHTFGFFFHYIFRLADVNGIHCRDAWYSHRNLSRTEAKRHYITTLINTMHRYASPTPEARELISELEFVWDQIKFNTSSSSSSPPQALGFPPSSHMSYENIGDRLSRAEYDRAGIRDPGRDSRLRVLSPVSQPEDRFSRENYGSDSEMEQNEGDGEEEEEEEEFQEARNSPYEEEGPSDESTQHQIENGETERDILNRRWRRRVEGALTKMTAEVAAMREQMETRSNFNRRRSSIWAWLKWLVWVAIRQLCWDIAILGTVLIYLRFRGETPLRMNMKSLWLEVKQRLSRIRFFQYFLHLPAVP